MNQTRIILVMDNVHMGLSHDGLGAIAKKHCKSPDKLEMGELMLFMNRAKDKLKILGGGGKVVGYLKMPKGQRIMMEAIQYIPQSFGAMGFNYNEALKKAIAARLYSAPKVKTAPMTVYLPVGGTRAYTSANHAAL